MLEPICSPIWVALFVGEIPGSLALLGGMLVLITLFLRYIAMAYHTLSHIAMSNRVKKLTKIPL